MSRLLIEHLARIEGHGAINVEVEGKKVKKVRMEIFEGPRLFETLSLGKLPSENLNIVPRICAICTLSHKYASLRGLEKCLDIKVPKKTHLLRELMLIGEIIESHSLHVYLLALPDLVGYPSAIAMVDKYGDAVKEGLALKKFGNRVMEAISARATHGENPVIGGFGKIPSKELLLEIKAEAKSLIPYIENGIELLGQLKCPRFLEKETVYICLKPPAKKYGFSGEEIIASDGNEFDVDDFKKHIDERVVTHSYAKRSSYNGKPYSVGALARINNIGNRLTGKAAKYYKRYWNRRWLKNPLYNNLAQAIEILFALEEIPRLIDKINSLNDPGIIESKKKKGKGTGTVEAPRGLLVHSYEIENGRMAAIDIVTPTAQNLDDIERYLRLTTEQMLSKGKKDDCIINQLEIVARSYDPCISCSAHLVKLARK